LQIRNKCRTRWLDATGRVKNGALVAETGSVHRLIKVAIVLALLAVPPLAAAAPAPPVIIVTPPPAPPAPTPTTPTAPAPPVAAPPAAAPPAAGPPVAKPVPPSPFDWARPAALRLAASGLWPELAAADLGRDATKADLDRAIGILRGRPVTSPDPASPATAIVANLRFVRALDLEPERRGLMALATADGQRLRLPSGFGSEILARELGLVYNYPAPRDDLERGRREPVHLADIVGKLDRARQVSSWTRQRLMRYRTIQLPAMSAQRLAIVQAAIAQVGQPYVWGGDWPGPHSPWGAQAHGGFDCSGLVWWAFKGAAGTSQMALGTDIVGRTADQMAFERPTEREPVAAAAPGDLVFFGPEGPKSKRGTIGHEGIALGNGWMIQSSGSRGGVAISFLEDYWPSATAFARRPAALGP
jgi:cell wall-associated NlpC family hydrolase